MSGRTIVSTREVTAKDPDAWVAAVNAKWAEVTPTHPTYASLTARIVSRGGMTPSGRIRFVAESTIVMREETPR